MAVCTWMFSLFVYTSDWNRNNYSIYLYFIIDLGGGGEFKYSVSMVSKKIYIFNFNFGEKLMQIFNFFFTKNKN